MLVNYLLFLLTNGASRMSVVDCANMLCVCDPFVRLCNQNAAAALRRGWPCTPRRSRS